MFGRLPHFDEASRAYPIRALLPPRAHRSYTWRCAKHLDQQQTPRCVGYTWAHDRIARPVERTEADTADADAIYARAQQLDPWPGDDYAGTSVLAGAKAAQEARWVHEYRWGFTLDDTLAALAWHGPVILGVAWRTGMMTPDSDGILHATGGDEGGHAILCKAINVRRRLVTLHNSWGPGWGRGGDAWLTWDDLGQLLAARGEALIPVRR